MFQMQTAAVTGVPSVRLAAFRRMLARCFEDNCFVRGKYAPLFTFVRSGKTEVNLGKGNIYYGGCHQLFRLGLGDSIHLALLCSFLYKLSFKNQFQCLA